MNKNNVVNYLYRNWIQKMQEKKEWEVLTKKQCREKKESEDILIQYIEVAREEWETSIQYFELVSEPKLVDYAIYREEAAKARYLHLLLEAKRLGVKVDCSSSLEKIVISHP